ncbi:MAG: hypothetical protein HY376_04105 [Candidatus Blackburnbacteria bacterium]|nr:hypothetical protein [Candidatus Blackburnbacteria bacterium]
MAETLSPYTPELNRPPSGFEQSQLELERITEKESLGQAEGADILKRGEILEDRERWGANARRMGAFSLADERLSGVLEAAVNSSRPLDYVTQLIREEKLAHETEADLWGERRFRNNPDLSRQTYQGIVEIYVSDALEDIRDSVRGDAPPTQEEWKWDIRAAVREVEGRVAGAAPEPRAPEPARPNHLEEAVAGLTEAQRQAVEAQRQTAEALARLAEENRLTEERRRAEEATRAARGPEPARVAGVGEHDPYNEERFIVWNDPEDERVDRPRAFSRRWARSHGLPDTLLPGAGRGAVMRRVHSNEVLSGFAETGNNPIVNRALDPVIASAKEDGFTEAAAAGLLPLLHLDRVMRGSRLEYVAQALETNGPTPDGVARWLRIDSETRRCLALLLKLQGYRVAVEPGVHDVIEGLGHNNILVGIRHKFSDVRRVEGYDGQPVNDKERNADLKRDELHKYLEAVQKAVDTDPGVVRVAYTIFRYFGFPHENSKFLDLYNKYLYDERNPNGDLKPEKRDEEGKLIEAGDLTPFIDKIKDPVSGRMLAEVVAQDGMIAFANALEAPDPLDPTGTEAQRVRRDWEDLKLVLDVMDSVAGARTGQGPSGANVDYGRRLEIIQKAFERDAGVAQVKRKISQEAVQRIVDPSRIRRNDQVAKVSTIQRETQGAREVLHQVTAPVRGIRSFDSWVRKVTGQPPRKDEQ